MNKVYILQKRIVRKFAMNNYGFRHVMYFPLLTVAEVGRMRRATELATRIPDLDRATL